jgi:Secretion system C-terminal sorting domain
VIAQSHTNQVNVSKVAGGIYFLEIETPGYTTNKKIIVTH